MASFASRAPLALAFSCLVGLAIAPAVSGKQSSQGRKFPTAEQLEILDHLSIEYLDDGQGGLVKTVRLAGTNFQVVDGSGTTNGNKTGLGNLIVGYNEFRGPGKTNNRTGSHNIVGGFQNNFRSFGGLVVGTTNSISGRWATIGGGFLNVSKADWSSVGGGRQNVASGSSSCVSGGRDNRASGDYASVSGGHLNSSTYSYASVSGGGSNMASGRSSSVSGGWYGLASGGYASVSGGWDGVASAFWTSISGGTRNTASSAHASVSGGRDNNSQGYYGSISGGAGRTIDDTDDWAAGTLFEDN